MNTLVLIGLALVVAGLVLLAVRFAPRVRRQFAASAAQPRTVADLVRLREETGGTPKPPADTAAGRAVPAPAPSAPATPAPGVPAPAVPASAATSRVAVAARPAGHAPAAARPAPPAPRAAPLGAGSPAPDPDDPPAPPFVSPAPRPAPGRLRREREPADPPPVVLDGGDAPWQRGARMAAGLGGGQPWREPPPPPAVPLRIIRSTEPAPVHPAASAPSHVAEPAAQAPVRLVPDEPAAVPEQSKESPAVVAAAADPGDPAEPAPVRPAAQAPSGVVDVGDRPQRVVELAEHAARRGAEQAESPPEVSEVAVEPQPPAPAVGAEPAAVASEMPEREPERQAAAGVAVPEGREPVEPALAAPDVPPARTVGTEPAAAQERIEEAEPAAAYGVPDGSDPEWQAAAGVAVPDDREPMQLALAAPEVSPVQNVGAEPVASGIPGAPGSERQSAAASAVREGLEPVQPALAAPDVPPAQTVGAEPVASGIPGAPGPEPQAAAGSAVPEGLEPVEPAPAVPEASPARTVGGESAAASGPGAPEPEPQAPTGSAVPGSREPVESRSADLADGTRDAPPGQSPLPGGWDDVEAEDVPAGAVPDRFADEPTEAPEAQHEEAGPRRSRQTPDELAVEQAAADLALLRTFGFADPGLRPDTAPVVAMERPEEQGSPAAAGNAQPVRYRVVRRDGSVVGGATVTLLDDRGGDVAAGTADAEGRGEMLAPGPGGYVLVSTAAGHQPGAVAITVAGSATEADVLLARSASVSGSVQGEDGPIGGARVTLVQDGEAVDAVDTDADGAYRIGDIGAGEYGLSVAAAGCEPVATLLDVPEEADVRHDVELRSASPVADGDLVDDATSGLR
jgi:Carboxypeptidase regulatory-like domain